MSTRATKSRDNAPTQKKSSERASASIQSNIDTQVNAWIQGMDIPVNPDLVGGLQRRFGNQRTIQLLREREASRQAATTPDISTSNDTVVQRKVGFEFEADAWNTYIQQRALTKNEEKIKKKDPAKQNPTLSSSKDNPNPFVKPPRKGAVIGRGPGYEIQADEKEDTHGDLEFVTDPFDETPEGFAALQTAMTSMVGKMDEIVALPYRGMTGAYNWPDEHKLTSMGILLSFGDRPMKLKPQVTGGIKTDRIANVLENMGTAPDESKEMGEKREGGRGALLAKGSSTAKFLGMSPSLARFGIGSFKVALDFSPLHKDKFENTDALEGVVSLIVAYLKMGMMPHANYPKTMAPLMARTNFATLFNTLPDEQKEYFQANRESWWFIISSAVNYSIGSVSKKEHWVAKDTPVISQFVPGGKKPQLTEIKAGDWIMGLLDGKDILTVSGFKQYLADLEGHGNVDSLSKDKKEYADWLESFGLLGNKTDAEGTGIFEFRGIPTMLKHTEVEEFALNFHKYITNLNQKKKGETFYGKQE